MASSKNGGSLEFVLRFGIRILKNIKLVTYRPGISNFQCLSFENLVTFSSFWCVSFYVLGNLVPVKYIFISKFAIKEHTLCS